MVCVSAASPAPRRRWNSAFLAMLPAIVQRARFAFRDARGQDRQDLVQEVIANALVAFVALVRRGKMAIAYPSVLARYAIAQINDGRKVGGHLNCKDVSSRYCQRLKGAVLERLDRFDTTEEAWQEVLVEDRHAGPAEIACTKIDFEEWLKSLPVRYRRLAQYLSLGHRTSDAARKFKVSAGRISQLRKELAENWRRFVGDEPDDDAAAAVLAA